MAKKIPMRMCVSCREMQPKKELVRVVRTPEGAVVLDTTGRANGRGAYLCKKCACLEKAIKSRALERALRALRDAACAEELDCAATDVKEALHHLGSITGTDVDAAVIDRIFERFCVGK